MAEYILQYTIYEILENVGYVKCLTKCITIDWKKTFIMEKSGN